MRKRGWISLLLATAMLCVPLSTVLAETEPTEVEIKSGPTRTESQEANQTGEPVANFRSDALTMEEGHIEIRLNTGDEGEVQDALLEALDGESPDDVRSIEVLGAEVEKEGLHYLRDILTELEILSMPDQKVFSGDFKQHPTLQHLILPSVEFFTGDISECDSLQSVYLLNVTDISAGAFYRCANLQSIDLPEVTRIREKTFGRCTNLASINLPKVKTIGAEAFTNCESLQSVDLPNATHINEYAFTYCGSLQSIDLPNATHINEYAFSNCGSLQGVDFPNATLIEQQAFAHCGSLQSVDFPKATEIGNSVFGLCENLETVNLPNAVNIGAYAFSSTGLKSIDLPKAEIIEDSTFYVSESLKTANLPSATYIGKSAFFECKNLESVNAPNVTVLGEESDYPMTAAVFFSCSSLKSIDMPKVTSITDFTFGGCRSLKTANLPSVESISTYAFNGCSSLETVNLPSVESIDEHSFTNCRSLKTLNLPSVTSIAWTSFDGCLGLESVYLPVLENLPPRAFRHCASLTSVSIPKVRYIDVNAFEGCPITQITIPESIAGISSEAFAYTQLKKIVFLRSDEPPFFGYEDGNGIFGKDEAGNSVYRDVQVYVPMQIGDEYRDALKSDPIHHIYNSNQIIRYNGDEALTGIDLGEDEELFLGENVTKAVVFTGKAWDESLTWTSSNPDVATVDSNGTITAHGAGVAEITAISNMVSSVSDTCKVTVHGTPVFTEQPADQGVFIGEQAIFTAATEGKEVSLQWQVKENNAWIDITGETESSYRMTATLEDNEKQYRCVASNKSGSVNSDAATLTVVKNPELPDYSFAGGANYTKGSGEDLVLKIEKDFMLYDTVLINGAEPKEGDYDVKSGSTVVTLYSDYLNSLEVGRQEIRVLFSDGIELVASFEIVAEASGGGGNGGSGSLVPAQSDDGTGATGDKKTTSSRGSRGSRTGDSSNVWVLAVLGLFALVAMVGLVIKRTKKNH